MSDERLPGSRFSVKVTYVVVEEYTITTTEPWAYSRAAQHVQEQVRRAVLPSTDEATTTHRITSVYLAKLADDE